MRFPFESYSHPGPSRLNNSPDLTSSALGVGTELGMSEGIVVGNDEGNDEGMYEGNTDGLTLGTVEGKSDGLFHCQMGRWLNKN